MDEMDYDMHGAPAAANTAASAAEQPPTSLPTSEAQPVSQCPYLLPSPSRATTSGTVYDPLSVSHGRASWSSVRQPPPNTLVHAQVHPDPYGTTAFWMLQQPASNQADRSQQTDPFTQTQSRLAGFGAPPHLPHLPYPYSGMADPAPYHANTAMAGWERRVGSSHTSSQQQPQQLQEPPHRNIPATTSSSELQEHHRAFQREEQPETQAPTQSLPQTQAQVQQPPAIPVPSQSAGTQLPRVASILNTPAPQTPVSDGSSQDSSTPSRRSQSPASAHSDGAATRQGSGRRPLARPTRPSLSMRSFGILDFPPAPGSHATFGRVDRADRALWEAEGPSIARANVSNRHSMAGRLETAQPISPLSPAAGSGFGANTNERRIRATLIRRRPGHSMDGGHVRGSDLDSDDDMEGFNEQRAIHRFIDHLEGGLIAGVSQQTFSSGGVRARQVLRGTTSNSKRVASRSAIASLVCVDVETLSPTERTCIICYNDFGVLSPEGINEAPLRLPKCKHVFGDHCIKKWFEESDSCPYCRDKVPSEPMVTVSHDTFQQFVRAQHLQNQMRADRRLQMSANTPSILAQSQAHARLLSNGERESAPQDAPSPVYGGPGPGRASAAGDRRSAPDEFNEGPRRTRARHSTFRTAAAARPFSTSVNTTNAAATGPGVNHPTPRAPGHHPTALPVSTMSPLRPPTQAAQATQPMQIPYPLPVPTQGGPGRCVHPYQPTQGNNYMWQPPMQAHYGGTPSGLYQMQLGYTYAMGQGPGMGPGSHMSFPAYSSPYNTGGGEGGGPFSQAAPTLPVPTTGDGRHAFYTGMAGTTAPTIPSMPAMPAMPSMEAAQGAAPTLPVLPPISRFDIPSRLAGPGPMGNVQQDNSLPTSSTGWGPA